MPGVNLASFKVEENVLKGGVIKVVQLCILELYLSIMGNMNCISVNLICMHISRERRQQHLGRSSLKDNLLRHMPFLPLDPHCITWMLIVIFFLFHIWLIYSK